MPVAAGRIAARGRFPPGDPPDVAAEATKVRMSGDAHHGDRQGARYATTRWTPACSSARRRCSGRSTTPRASGDTTLSGGIRQLAARGLMRGVDVGAATWYDIDTMADLATRRDAAGAQPEPNA